MDSKRIGAEVVLGENDSYQHWVEERRQYVSALIDKWQWLLEGTKKQQLRPIPQEHWGALAMLFENQAWATKRYEQSVLEATTTGDAVLPVTYTLPIIRNVYPNLIVMKIASVQPLPASSGGVGNVFYMDFLREDAGDTNLTVPDSDYAFRGENEVPRRVKMQIQKTTITAEKMILGASWSSEIEEDARGALNIDVENELITQMSLEIQREIDQIVLNEILLWAEAGNVNWSWTMPGSYVSAKDYYQTIGHALVDMEDLIYGSRYRQMDWVIAGRNVVKYIRKMQDFKPAPRNQPIDPFQVSVEFVGRLEGFWDVYLTSHINTNRAIGGCYPRSQTDTGYIFAPYIPLMPMPKVYAEFMPLDDSAMPGAYVNTDKWSRNVRTRFGKKLVVPELYATMSISA